MGKINSNAKGKAGERECAELLRSHGFEARRGQQFSGGEDSPDVVSDLGFHIEVKRVESLSLYTAVEQAKRDCKNDSYTIFHRKNGKSWVTIMDSNEFLKIMRELHTLRENEARREAEFKVCTT